jgi:hypothetical protein
MFLHFLLFRALPSQLRLRSKIDFVHRAPVCWLEPERTCPRSICSRSIGFIHAHHDPELCYMFEGGFLMFIFVFAFVQPSPYAYTYLVGTHIREE